MDRHPVVVVGAGAAGLLAALFAARSGSDVVLLERTRDGGRKILISGGGRCNILPSVARPDRYVTDSSPNLLKKILLSWPLREQIEFFERELGQPLVLEEESAKLFPASNRARDVRDRLVARAREAGVVVRFDSRVTGLKPMSSGTPRGPQAMSEEPPGEGRSDTGKVDAGTSSDTPTWQIQLDGAPPIQARSVIVATGGLSVPATGSDGAGLAFVRTLGHTVHDPYPALTPLLADPPVHADLAGVSLEVTLHAPGARPRFEARGGFLFTHRGYSGPVVLDASHLAVRAARRGESQVLSVQWTPDGHDVWNEDLQGGAGLVMTRLARRLPARLATRLLVEADIPGDCRVSQLPRQARRTLVGLLTDYPLPWTGDEGYKKAEVTGGGVALAEVDPRTMESRVCPGLFLCGEILDAFGPIGGHNFLWAWATGRAAGLGAAKR